MTGIDYVPDLTCCLRKKRRWSDGDGHDIWTEDLTDKQLAMIRESGEEAFGMVGNGGAGVELRGAGDWRVARSLVAMGLGAIEGGAPNGSELLGLFFNNEEAVRILHEFDDEDYGNG